ncbi:zinc finger protein OZF-like [Microplitis demolitor]|uniref:zinc finger protein OZF-like n=1 Tax=Microplitis demolitor TaxID=69319 RepID=UPI00235B66DA|nr:zinc finger protein OZF-like [Microplitis demolitor]
MAFRFSSTEAFVGNNAGVVINLMASSLEKCVKVVDTSRVEVLSSTRVKILQQPKDQTENSNGRELKIPPVVNKNSVTAKEPILKYYCKSCGVVYSGRASDPQTEVFKRMHSKKHFTKCLQCSETFALAKDYLKHVDEAHELKYYKCEHCWYRTTSVRQYESHKRTRHRQVLMQVKKFSCGRCLEKDMTHSQYQIHLCAEDDIARKREKDKEGEILLCEFCGYTSRKKKSMKLHINQYHAERKFGCNICEKKFISDQGLVKHMNYHKNPVTKVRKLFCDHCGKGFKDKPALRMHIMNTHMGMKLAKCSICHKSFAKKTTLRQHLLTHSGKRPYTCDICGKTFVQKPALSSHRKQHPGKLPPMPVVYIDSYIRELDPSMVTSSIVPVPKLRTESQTYDDFRSNLKP